MILFNRHIRFNKIRRPKHLCLYTRGETSTCKRFYNSEGFFFLWVVTIIKTVIFSGPGGKAFDEVRVSFCTYFSASIVSVKNNDYPLKAESETCVYHSVQSVAIKLLWLLNACKLH